MRSVLINMRVFLLRWMFGQSTLQCGADDRALHRPSSYPDTA
jgi:hypothetical protein